MTLPKLLSIRLEFPAYIRYDMTSCLPTHSDRVYL